VADARQFILRWFSSAELLRLFLRKQLAPAGREIEEL
jgi:hypothetical protein